jgi:VWFA-related protein
MRAAASLLLGAMLIAAAPEGQQPPLFRVAADLVTVDTLVLRGRTPVPNLTAADFALLDNGVPQDIAVADVPGGTHVIAVVDTSASVEGDILRHLTQALTRVFSALTADDRVSVVTFGDTVRIVASAETPGSHLEEVVSRMTAVGGTALHDAIVVGAGLAALDERPALLVVFTDGSDTVSATSASQVLSLLRASNVVAFTVGANLQELRYALGAALRRPRPYFERPAWILADLTDAPLLLHRVAQVTGGAYAHVGQPGEIARTLTDALARYRSRYILSYTPTGVGTDDGWHTIEVRLKSQRGTVHARDGYYAGRR